MGSRAEAEEHAIIEIRIAMKARACPYVPTVLAWSRSVQGAPILVSRFCGRILNKVLTSEALTIEDRLDISASLCEALDSLHHSGVLHGDLKGNNICYSKSQKTMTLITSA